MEEKTWLQFVSTGRIDDYLAYSMEQERTLAAERAGQEAKEREREHGADHCAYRYGAGSDTHWGL